MQFNFISCIVLHSFFGGILCTWKQKIVDVDDLLLEIKQTQAYEFPIRKS